MTKCLGMHTISDLQAIFHNKMNYLIGTVRKSWLAGPCEEQKSKSQLAIRKENPHNS